MGREAIEGRLDRQLDIFGIHFSAQYKDPAMRSKGGKWHLKVDDMKRIFPRAHSKAIEVNVDFEPSETKKPADNFKFNVKYALTHGDGDGDEKGTLMITRQKEGDMWTTKVKTTGELMPQGTIIPKRIRNMDWQMSSDRQTKFNFDYKFELFLPILLNKIYSDMNEYKMSVDHVPGDHLNIQTNGKKFKSFVIAKTGNNNERKIEINGKQLASGDYTLTDNSFKTKITLQNGDWLEPKVTWEGALPKSRSEAEKFFLKNNFKISATGSKRNYDIDLSWKATKPDWDFSTPESLKIDINAKGESPRWGNWMLSRDASFKVENKVIQADVSGKAHFKGGLLATSTPIVTEVHMKYLIPQRDLQGKFSKVINGKEYSIEFPDGFGVMPMIKMGQ